MNTIAKTGSAVPRTTDQNQIEELATAFGESWNTHDMARFAGLFAHDADFVNVVGMWWKNREEIEKAHAHTHSTFFKDSRLSVKTAAVKFLRPDVATAHVLWELVGQIEPDRTVGKPRHGVLLLVCAKQNGSWLIHTAQNTDIVAAALTRPGEKT
jgi:uncharacterized protein (TIGR02246 family)